MLLFSNPPHSPFRKPVGTTLQQRDSLRRLQERYAENGNPSCFYQIMDLRNTPTIIWSHNGKAHIGQSQVSYVEFFNRIHPHWRETIKASITEAFGCFASLKNNAVAGQYNYSNNVPLRQRDGSYFWYKQRTFPVSFDALGNPVHVFSEFYRLCPFHNLVPSPATIMVHNGTESRCSKKMLVAGGIAMGRTLKTLLTAAGYRNLLVYREACKMSNGEWSPPSSQEVLARLMMNQQALNRANTRVLGAAKICFPASTLSSMADFAVFLNTAFGCPQREC